jgi:hypothetical protein
VAALILVAAVAATAVWRLDESPTGALGPGSVTRVGVRDGDLVAEYLAASRAELDRLVAQGRAGSAPREIYALVSLTAYLSPDAIAALIASAPDGLNPVVAYARVPLTRRQTQLVRLGAQRLPGDVIAAMIDVADRKDRDARYYARLAEDDEFSERMRALYASNGEVAREEALAYRAGCACVFALVVRAGPAVLAGLAAQPVVRVVDAAPEVTDVARTVFVAPLPEHLGRVEPLPDDGLVPAPATTT